MLFVCRCIRYSYIYKACMSPVFHRSSVIRHFECSDVIEISDGIIFDFYAELSHRMVLSTGGHVFVHMVTTVDLEIFVVKNFSLVA